MSSIRFESEIYSDVLEIHVVASLSRDTQAKDFVILLSFFDENEQIIDRSALSTAYSTTFNSAFIYSPQGLMGTKVSLGSIRSDVPLRRVEFSPVVWNKTAPPPQQTIDNLYLAYAKTFMGKKFNAIVEMQRLPNDEVS